MGADLFRALHVALVRVANGDAQFQEVACVDILAKWPEFTASHTNRCHCRGTLATLASISITALSASISMIRAPLGVGSEHERRRGRSPGQRSITALGARYRPPH